MVSNVNLHLYIGVAQQVWEVGPVTVSNGLGWSPDDSVFYHTDSPAKCVMAFDFDKDTAILSAPRVFASTADICPYAVPDGLAVDAEGGVW